MNQETMPFSYTDVVARFAELRPRYKHLAKYLCDWFTDTTHSIEINAIVQSRAKTVESFAEKIVRPGKNYNDPLRELSDLCGVRVIVHTLDQIETVARILEREFSVDPQAMEDTEARLAYGEFGYLSRHYDLKLKKPPQIAGLSDEERAALTELKFELQLRTIAQHAWADVNHDIGYKNEFKLPRRWKREWARAAALLEQCDRTFLTIKEGLKTYESNYSAYMTQDELRELGDRLETLLTVGPDNKSAMHRLVRVYMALNDATEVLASALQRFSTKLETYPPALRDIGVALCQIHEPGTSGYADGISQLQRAVEAESADVDALCSLGGALRRQGDVDQAIDCYRRAHHLDPTNPYPLGNYVAEELIRRKDPEVLDFFRSAITQAAQRCRNQIEIQVNLPWALFDLGMFSLYLNDIESAVGDYARGIVDAPNDWMIRSANKGVARFIESGVKLSGVDLIDKLLKLGWWANASETERAAANWRPAAGPVAFDHSPLLILAGSGADVNGIDEAGLLKLRELLSGYQGIIVSGGTNCGVALVAGDLGASNKGNNVQTIGYLPKTAPDGLERWFDKRYHQHRHSTGENFSVLDPLTFWEDWLAAGREPSEVQVIGYGGGATASGEYRIALALGAQVGVIQGSGRAADALLSDPLWKNYERLAALTLTSDNINGFLRQT